MMTDNDDYSKQSPDSLLGVFSRSRMLFYCLVAVGVHLVVLAVTSTSYIYDTWIDPEGAKERAVQEAKEAEENGAAEEQGSSEEKPAEVKADSPATDSPMVIGDTVVPDSATNSAIIKAITEVADPDEIPDEPDLGIDLDDTRVR
ncbi:MAG: hypothetical protein QGH42_00695 [Kiritimatiellia bacterium]|jgi:hypothetical protein|nr:hypothetical protein [Kiritimatiellia bacterium]MDP6810256.1 hypothetical protein [Kiritimatiellia bacterium]MDP7022755.1 hypothetical protein [Kiritimatiellia bacterium]